MVEQLTADQQATGSNPVLPSRRKEEKKKFFGEKREGEKREGEEEKTKKREDHPGGYIYIFRPQQTSYI